MTVEELDIIVDASVEKAVKEFEKLVPAIQKTVKQVTEKINSTDFNSLKNKTQQAVQFAKTKIDNLIKSNKNNKLAIQVTNKEASKQISQLEKEIDSLQRKINARQLKLDIINPQIDGIVNKTKQEVVPEGISLNSKAMDTVLNNALSSNKDFTSLSGQAEKLYTEIELYNNQIEKAKSKMGQLRQETNQTATTQNKLGSFFSRFKTQIGQTVSNTKGLKGQFNQLPKITQNITNNIKGMGTHLKSNLSHVLKYAGALFSLRGIYSILSNSAGTWLSSQNAGAKQLSANIDYMKYAMGSALAPVIQFVTNLVYQLMKAIQSVVYALTGVNIFAKASAKSYASMAGSAKKAKEETKQLAGIHNEINNISDNKDSGGGSGGTGTPNFDLSKLDKTPNNIIDAIKNGNWYEVGATIGQKLNEAMSSIPWDKIQNTARKIGRGTAELLNGFIATTDWKQVGNTFAQGINTVIYFGYEFVTTFDWKQFGKAIGDSINGFFKNIDWKTAGKTFGEGIKGLFDTISGFFQTFDWSTIIDGLIDFLTNIDWSEVVSSMFEALGSACASFVNLGMIIGEYIGQAFQGIEQYFQDKIEECGGNVVLGILKGIVDAVVGIGQWIYDNIFKPFIDGFKEAFGIHSPSTVMEEQGRFIIDGLKNGLSNVWEKVSSIFTNLKENIINKFTEIKTNIGNWANNTKETIRGWADTARGKISECWSNASNTVREKINSVKTNISIGLGNAKSTITTWAGNVKSTWSTHWNDMSRKVKSGLDTAKSHISNWGSNTKTTFTDIGRNAKTWGKDLVTNIANGIKNNISKVTNAVNSVANKIKSFLHFSEPDVGPLSNFHTYMPDMMDLMSEGIHSNIGKVTGELENLTGTMSYTINEPNISPQEIMSDTFENISFGTNKNTQPLHVTIQYLGKTIFDDTINYINDKTRRTGKDTIVTVGG